MTQNIHRPVSNRGQWRDTFVAHALGGVDPATAVFRIEAYRTDGGGYGRDYGMLVRSTDRPALPIAATNDGTGRLAVGFDGIDVALTWLFSAADMRALSRGSYVLRIFATIGGDDSELDRLNFVVR